MGKLIGGITSWLTVTVIGLAMNVYTPWGLVCLHKQRNLIITDTCIWVVTRDFKLFVFLYIMYRCSYVMM